MRRGAPKCDPAIFRARHSGARHLLRHAAGLRGARRQGRKRAGPRVWPGPLPASSRTRDLFAGVPDETRRLDEPRRPGQPRVATISCRWPRRRPARSPRSSTQSLPIFGVQFHPEVTHTPLRQPDPAQFPHGGLRLRGHVEAGRLCRSRPIAQMRERDRQATA